MCFLSQSISNLINVKPQKNTTTTSYYNKLIKKKPLCVCWV